MNMLGEQVKELREAARNLQGKLGRCLYRRKDVDEMQKISGLLFEAADTIESLRDRMQERQHDHPYVGLVLGKYREKTENGNYYCGRCGYPVTDHDSYCRECGGALHESHGQVPEQGERENDGGRESCGEVCGDDRFELIGKAKGKLLECTNIESRPEEVAVLDSILFRCWQMGWLDRLRDDDSRHSELFGTPERAARTIANACTYHGSFDCSYGCLADETSCGCGNYVALFEWLRG